jgi:hypothetical protein
MANYRKSFNFRNGVQVDDDNFIVNPNGLVGIGTSVPTEFLDVRGTTKVVGLATIKNIWVENIYVSGLTTSIGNLRVGITSFSNTGIITATSTSGIITYYGDGGKLLNLPTSQWIDVDPGFGYTSIYASGNVGIATTYPNFSLQIGGNPDGSQQGVGINSTGNIKATGIVTTRQLQFVGVDAGITGVTSIFASTTQPLVRITQLGSGLSLLVEDSGSPDSSPFAIDGAGRAFIGTTGDSSLIDGLTFFNSYARFISTITGNTATDGMLIGEGPSDNGYQNIYSYDRPLKIETNGTRNHISLIPSSTSNIGLGTTNPTSKVSVLGNVLVSGVTTVTELKASISTTGISTVTEYLHVGTGGTLFTLANNGRFGIGTAIPSSEYQFIKPTESLFEIISQDGATNLSLGSSIGTGNSSTVLRYSAKTFEIKHNDTGNVNHYIHAGGVGINTGRFNWIYGQGNQELMSLTYQGNLGLGLTNPSYKLHVVGTSTITGDTYIGGNLIVAGIITSASQQIQLPNVLNNVQLNNNIGVTTLNTLLTSSIGIGTTNPIVGFDQRFGGTLLTNNIGVSTTTSNLFGHNLYVNGTGAFNAGLGIGTNTFYNPPGTYTPYLQVHNDASAFYNNIITYHQTSRIGYGTYFPRSVLDLGSARVGTAGTNPYAILPNEPDPNTNIVAVNRIAGGLLFNNTIGQFQGYSGTAWVGLLSPEVVRIASDRTKATNNNTLEAVFPAANDTATLLANTLYKFRAVYVMTKTASGSAAGLQVGFTFSNAQQSIGYKYKSFTQTSSTTQTSGYATVVTATTVTPTGTAAENYVIELEGWFVSNATTGGTFRPDFAQSVAGSVVAPTVSTNTFFELYAAGSASAANVSGSWA